MCLLHFFLLSFQNGTFLAMAKDLLPWKSWKSYCIWFFKDSNPNDSNLLVILKNFVKDLKFFSRFPIINHHKSLIYPTQMRNRKRRKRRVWFHLHLDWVIIQEMHTIHNVTEKSLSTELPDLCLQMEYKSFCFFATLKRWLKNLSFQCFCMFQQMFAFGFMI